MVCNLYFAYKQNKDKKHIPFVAYSTSILFGLVHFLNILKGAALSDTLWQCISAVGIGVMFGAIYFRTGNIVLCMILHTLHDMLALMVVGATDSKLKWMSILAMTGMNTHLSQIIVMAPSQSV